ncbi:hypothetical protein CON38_07780 [Bacillus cereus]|nr:hypothetical protein ICU_03874 [Bacillus cereus BAG2X1-1]PEA09792.1 hypothetical protein CON38_07780 [Bacillus cereus]
MSSLFLYGDKFLGFGLSKLSVGVESLFLLTLLFALLITMPKLRRDFTGYFFLSDKKHLIIGLPILFLLIIKFQLYAIFYCYFTHPTLRKKYFSTFYLLKKIEYSYYNEYYIAIGKKNNNSQKLGRKYIEKE